MRYELLALHLHCKAERLKISSLSSWEFWQSKELLFPTWFKMMLEISLIAPLSACCERFFSFLTNGFGDQQDNALEDYKSTSCILRYNEAKRKSEARLID